MKRMVPLLLIAFASLSEATPRGLEMYAPRYSFLVIGADFAQLRDNEIFTALERSGKIWSDKNESEIAEYFEILKITPAKDIRSFIFSRYLNSYGSSGRLHVFELARDLSAALQAKPSTKYLEVRMYRLVPDEDMYAAMLTSTILALGSLNEVKMGVDLLRGKVESMGRNQELDLLFQELPPDSAIWGVAVPLSRRQAAAVKAKQSTNAILQGLKSYHFYGIPTKTQIKSHFYGHTEDEKQATLLNGFMIGLLTIAKLKVDEPVADMLDQVNLERNGNTLHASAVITKDLVDAYLRGELGVE